MNLTGKSVVNLMRLVALHIANGECAIRALKKAGIPGEFLPWDDLLYEGPVPIPEPLDRLSMLRAQFVSDAGWESLSDACHHFSRRNQSIEDFGCYDEVILWNSFELTDQLQLMQILHWFSRQTGKTRIRIIFIDDYLAEDAIPLVESYWGRQQDVTAAQISQASRRWTAFCSDSPLELYRLNRSSAGSQELPFIGKALDRLFQEFPGVRDGLSRTQRQILQALQAEPLTPLEIFDRSQSMESRRFMGDWSFWRVLDSLSSAPAPLIEPVQGGWQSFLPLQVDSHADFYTRRIAVTDAGRKALAVRLGALDLHGIDRWIGGVHLVPGKIWRWCEESGRFYATGR